MRHYVTCSNTDTVSYSYLFMSIALLKFYIVIKAVYAVQKQKLIVIST